MDPKEFINKVKKLIAIETKNAVKAEMQSLILENQKLKKRLLVLEQKINSGNNTSTFKKIMSDGTQKQQLPQKKQIPVLSKNPMLNNILKETMEEQYRTVNFDSRDVHGWHNQIQAQYNDIQMESAIDANIDDVIFQTVDIPDFNTAVNQRMASKGINMPNALPINTMIPEDTKGRLNGEALPDFLQNALTRDYSQLTKAISKKK